VLPSLDAGDEETYCRVNRPCAEATFESLVAGLKAFRADYRGQLWLEVMLVSGVNDSDEQIGRIAELIRQIQPDRIDLNTVARPPAEGFAQAVPFDRLGQICRLLGPAAQVIASGAGQSAATRPVQREQVLALLRRRACTAQQLAEGLSADPASLAQALQALLKEGIVELRRRQQEEYYILR